MRWQAGDTVFIGLNAPGPNNHYLTAGGRNGEFEDRSIANAFWLEHAANIAKRRRSARDRRHSFKATPDLGALRAPRPFRVAAFRAQHQPRDGFLEFKRSLVKVAAIVSRSCDA